MEVLTQFSLGVIFASLICAHNVHNVRGLWVRSVFSSVGLGAIQFLVVRWAASGDAAYLVFQSGCAAGAGLGCFLASRSISPRKGQRP